MLHPTELTDVAQLLMLRWPVAVVACRHRFSSDIDGKVFEESYPSQL